MLGVSGLRGILGCVKQIPDLPVRESGTGYLKDLAL